MILYISEVNDQSKVELFEKEIEREYDELARILTQNEN